MSQLSNKKVNRYLEMARQASFNSDYPRYKLGAVAIYKGFLLTTGHNTTKTSPVQKEYNRVRKYQVDSSFKYTNCLHAEVNCLNKIKNLDIAFNKVLLFVYRQHKDGTKALARPCKACMKFIKELGIQNIYYTTDNGWCHERIEAEQRY